MEIQEGSIP